MGYQSFNHSYKLTIKYKLKAEGRMGNTGKNFFLTAVHRALQEEGFNRIRIWDA